MDELGFGPNGGLIYCLEYVQLLFHLGARKAGKLTRQRFLLSNIDWLEEQLADYQDDYLIIDCPGQIEIFTHFPIMKDIISLFQRLNYNVAGVYLMDCQFITDESKYFSGVLSALSVMVQLEVPHVNVLSKMDLLGEEASSEIVARYLEADTGLFRPLTSSRYAQLTQAIVRLVEDYTMVSFVALNIHDEDSVETLLSQVDVALQWGEDEEVQEHEDPDIDE